MMRQEIFNVHMDIQPEASHIWESIDQRAISGAYGVMMLTLPNCSFTSHNMLPPTLLSFFIAVWIIYGELANYSTHKQLRGL